MDVVFDPSKGKRYTFPNHINDLMIDRCQTGNSEVYMVILNQGQTTGTHKHDEMEQIFYVVAGEGIITIGEGPDEKDYSIKPGNVIFVRQSMVHSVSPVKDKSMRYLAIDCFIDGCPEDEPTWDDHCKAACKELGWDFDKVTQ